ncbi:MAG: quinone oxidoreductase [Pseudomonadota bacterium]
MMKAVRVQTPGAADVMTVVDVETPTPGEGQLLVDNKAIGLNYIDVYHRSGAYPVDLPTGIGLEAGAVVEAVGPGVTDFAAGDRVAYCLGPLGAYAQKHVVNAKTIAKLPDAIAFETAAAMMLKGCTAEYLLKRTYPVKKGDWVLFHAAAGGVGLIAGQWLAHIGAHAIGTAGSAEKCALAKAHGYAHVINYQSEDFVARVKEITGGAGVHVVYDGVGASTFDRSLDCLGKYGMMVSYGNASGPVDALNTGLLAQKGSLYVTRPTLFTYYGDYDEAQQGYAALFDVVSSGAVKINIEQRYPLADIVQAHKDLEGRKTVGSTIILP